ncbi:MAG: EF-P 5-aminopentanol modification-associated protein YfmF [Eubacteriales bacterium]
MPSIQLNNGIHLHVIPGDRFKTEFLSISMTRPLRAEENTQNALLPYVLAAGCRTYGGQKGLNMALEELYGARLQPSVRKRGAYQSTGFTLSFLKNRFALEGEDISGRCLDVLRNVLLDPMTQGEGFDPTILGLEKNNLREKILSRVNDKMLYGVDRCTALMAQGTPWALSELGEAEVLEREVISPDNLYRHYRKWLTQSRIEVVYVGSMEPEEMAKQLEARFGDLHSVELEMKAQPVDVSQGQKGQVTETMALAQCKVTMGMTTGITVDDPLYFPMLMAVAVYGGGPTSKLFMNVREKMSLCYYAAARYSKANGQILVYSGIEQANLEVATAEILHQLEQLQQGQVTEEEFLAAQKSVVNALRSQQDSPAHLEEFLLSEQMASHPLDEQEYIGRVMQVTREQAVQAAAHIQLQITHVLQGEEANH